MSLLNEKFTPMLLGEVDKPFDDDEYIYEIKYNPHFQLKPACPLTG